MNIEELRTTPTKDLITYWHEALQAENQSLVNIYAYELTCRIWVPNPETTFENCLEAFGYQKIENKKTKKK